MTVHYADARTDLLKAAIHCFAQFGFSESTTRMIAQKAGRPVSLISHHFGGKDGLYVESFKYLLTLFRIPLAGRPDDHLPPGNPQEAAGRLREQILAFYQETCLRTDLPDELHRSGRMLMMFELRAPRPDVLGMIQKTLATWAEGMKEALRVLRPEAPEPEIAFLGASIMGEILTHSLLATINEAVWGDMAMPPGRNADLLMEHCLHGLGLAPLAQRAAPGPDPHR